MIYYLLFEQAYRIPAFAYVLLIKNVSSSTSHKKPPSIRLSVFTTVLT